MNVREVAQDFEGPSLERVAISQSYDSAIFHSCHRGHIILQFHHVLLPATVEAITHTEGVDKTDLYNQDAAIIVSIADGSDAFNVAKIISRLLREHNVINQDEVTQLYRLTDPKQKEKAVHVPNI